MTNPVTNISERGPPPPPADSIHQNERHDEEDKYRQQRRENVNTQGQTGHSGLKKLNSQPRAQIYGVEIEHADSSRPASVLEPACSRPIPLPKSKTEPPLHIDCSLTESSDDEWKTPLNEKSRTEVARKRQDWNAKVNWSTSKKGEWTGTDDELYRTISPGLNDLGEEKRRQWGDGRMNLSLLDSSNHGYLSQTSRPAPPNAEGLQRSTTAEPHEPAHPQVDEAVRSSESAPPFKDLMSSPARLNIVIMFIGSESDVRPFLKIGRILQENYGHRVRVAAHPIFRHLIEQESGLELFSVGGDSAELMASVVKNPDMLPKLATINDGGLKSHRDAFYDVFQRFWRACINASDGEGDPPSHAPMAKQRPFIADAIIANPPSYAHIHCAEGLSIPLHLMSIFPCSPTRSFPHPLVKVKRTNLHPSRSNQISYQLMELMTWQGLGDIVNLFRVKTLGLDPVSTLWTPHQLHRLRVPHSYLWSPGLLPKPDDWGPEVDVSGFVLPDLASTFEPSEALARFLDSGQQPIYIGFGSVVVDNPEAFTSVILDGVKQAGVRALISKDWEGIRAREPISEDVFLLEDTPHDWLFPRVSTVVHNGGARITAIGVKCGKPIMIVPFFGDQAFWGTMVARAGAGATEAISPKRLTAERFALGIQQCLSDSAITAAARIAQDIAAEGDGAQNAVDSFHRHLSLNRDPKLRCSVFHDHTATWENKERQIRLSTLAASALVLKDEIGWNELILLRTHDWDDLTGPREPITAASGPLLDANGTAGSGGGRPPVKWAKKLHRSDKSHRIRRHARKTSSQPESVTSQSNPLSEEGIEPELRRFLVNDDKKLYTTTTTEEGETTQNGNSRLSSSEKCHDLDKRSSSSGNSTHHHASGLAKEAGQDFAQASETIAKAPVDDTLALGQSFYNYGDRSVRRAHYVTGLGSGLRAAGHEFFFGMFDGVDGLVLHPYHGATEKGFLGFLAGIGKGVGSFVVKNTAAQITPIGYTLKGIQQEIKKKRNSNFDLRCARILQGESELENKPIEEREHLIQLAVNAWSSLSI